MSDLRWGAGMARTRSGAWAAVYAREQPEGVFPAQVSGYIRMDGAYALFTYVGSDKSNPRLRIFVGPDAESYVIDAPAVGITESLNSFDALVPYRSLNGSWKRTMNAGIVWPVARWLGRQPWYILTLMLLFASGPLMTLNTKLTDPAGWVALYTCASAGLAAAILGSITGWRAAMAKVERDAASAAAVNMETHE